MIAFNVLFGISDTRFTAIKRFFTESSGRALKMVECDRHGHQGAHAGQFDAARLHPTQDREAARGHRRSRTLSR
jgi:hypothetical protein